MKRREFIQCGIGMLCLWPPWQQAGGTERSVQILPSPAGDLAGEESESGFRQALARFSSVFRLTGHIVVVPSASALGRTAFPPLMRAARRGATVLIDLSDGFAPSSDIARTRIEIYRHLGIEVARPVKCSSGEYIHYQWPLPAQVRHFTRISFIAPGESETIAHLGSKPISIRKEIGMGSFILLGSTLGSLLLAGDEQAEDIFTSLLLVNGPNPVDLSREQVENRDRALQI